MLVVLAPLVVAPPWIAFTLGNSLPVLSVNAPTVSVPCPDGPFPPATVANTGAAALRWTAQVVGKSTVVPVVISPSSGTLSPGQSQSIDFLAPVSPASGANQAASITFSSNGGQGSVVYSCSG